MYKKVSPELKDTFWMKDVWQQRKPGKPYKKYIEHYVQECSGKFPPDETVNIAYMNLNKRGGFENHTPSRLNGYVKKYEKFIQREIGLIHPDVIICGGTFGTVKDLLMGISTGVEVWDCYHPCYSAKVKGKYKFNQDGKLEKLSPV